jgi:hypothetical protein
MPLKISFVVALAATLAMLSQPLTSAAAGEKRAERPTNRQCKIVGAISHRCYSFQSDTTWREGLADYHESNGGQESLSQPSRPRGFCFPGPSARRCVRTARSTSIASIAQASSGASREMVLLTRCSRSIPASKLSMV